MVTIINFLLMMPIHCHEIRLWELIKWSPKRKCFDLLSNSLNTFRKCIEISLENLYVDIGAKRVNGNWGFHEAEKNLEAAKQTKRRIAQICFPFKLKLKNIKKIYTQKLSLGPDVFLIEGFLRLYYSQGVQRLHIQAFLEKSFWNNSLKKVGSSSISGRLPSYPSPKPKFCPKWEVGLNVGLGEG